MPIISFWIFYFHFSRILLIQEEKLEPLRNITADPRIRLLNRLYAKKRKELKERGRLKVPPNCFLLLSSTHFICHTVNANCSPYSLIRSF